MYDSKNVKIRENLAFRDKIPHCKNFGCRYFKFSLSLFPLFSSGMESRFWKWGGLYYGPLIKSGGPNHTFTIVHLKSWGARPTGPLRWLHPWVDISVRQPAVRGLTISKAWEEIANCENRVNLCQSIVNFVNKSVSRDDNDSRVDLWQIS